MEVEDARFAHLKKDPRFKKVGKGKRKVKIDNRFKHMFTAPEFSSVDFMDKRGRKEKQVTKEKLEKFYELSSSGEEECEEEVNEECEEEVKEECEEEVNEESEEEVNEEVQVENVKKNLEATDVKPTETFPSKKKDKTKPFSPEPTMTSESEDDDSGEEEPEKISEEELSDSSDGESTDDEEMAAETAIDAWDEVNTCKDTISESTSRLSICNLNWDRMNATDIFVLCTSSLHEKSGSVLKVDVFPSQYGKEQLAKEQQKGPDFGDVSTETDVNNGKEYSTEALRKYQIDRLKYYYAIVTCDSIATADVLYKELDGVEYQLSSSVLDLRYVPDDMEFEDDPATSSCSTMPDLTTYKPPTFITTALQNSSVKLTWDETDRSRLQLTTKKFSANDLENVDFSAYLASSESESENEDGTGPSLEKYKALLAGIEEDEGEKDEVDKEMEITWTTGLEDNNEVVEEAEKNEERQENATLYAPDEKDDFFATDSVIDRPKKKKKKKKKQEVKELTKEESELSLLMESEKDDKKHFNMKKIVKSRKEDNFSVDIDDERFAAIKTSHHFAIDPSVPEFKATTQTQKLRAAQAAAMTENTSLNTSEVTERSVIEKIKSKTAEFQSKKHNSKLFKTKNKGIVSTNVSSHVNSENSLKLKKKKRKPEDNVLVKKSKKIKKSKVKS